MNLYESMWILFKLHQKILDYLSDSGCCITESGENIFDIVTFFHWNYSHLVFFINPNEEIGCFIVKDSTGIWPVTTTTLKRGLYNQRCEPCIASNDYTGEITPVGNTGENTCIYSHIIIHCSIVRYIESRKFTKSD